MQIHVNILSDSLSFTLLPLEIDHAEETSEGIRLERHLIFSGELAAVDCLNYFLFHMVPIFLVIDKSFGYVQRRSGMLSQHELSWSEKLDFSIFIHHIIQSLVAQLSQKWKLLKLPDFDFHRRIQSSFPYFVVKILLRGFQEHTFLRNDDGKNLTHLADASV